MENCYGLSYDGRYLYAVGKTRILCVELEGDLSCISAISVNTNDVAFLSVHRDKLYYADYKKQTVYCSDKNGEEIWSFNNEIMMKYPIGITTDQYGNTYVTCADSNKVLVISDDGKRFRELLNESAGLKDPRAIFYDEIENRLLVCNGKNGKTFVCTIK